MKIKSIEYCNVNSLNYDIEVVDNHNFITNNVIVHNCKGQNLTDKIRFVPNIPTEISCQQTLDIRGELVIYRQDFNTIADQFKNPRNACAGIMNQLHPDKALVEKVSFVAYEIMGGLYDKRQQLTTLADLNFTVTYWFDYATNFTKFSQRDIDTLLECATADYPYEIDGLVLSDSTYRSENVYKPVGQVAFKINQLTAQTKIVGIEWRGPSKDGKFIPVAKIEPTDLGGSTITYVTCHNIDYIKEHDLHIGSTIEIVKSGDVIPKIIKLVTNDTATECIMPPNICPACEEFLSLLGCDVMCVNNQCGDKAIFAVSNLMRKIGVADAAKQSLINWGITTFEALIAFKPKVGSVSENKFYDQLTTKLFAISPTDIFTKLNYHGLSIKTVSKLVERFGLDNLKHENFEGEFPMGVGQTTIDNFLETSEDNFRILEMITNDTRYSYKEPTKSNGNKPTVYNGSICFTGALNNMKRSEAEAKAIAMGWSIGGVNKNLTVLVCNDSDSTSGKMGKAKSLGIKIMTEQEFFGNV